MKITNYTEALDRINLLQGILLHISELTIDRMVYGHSLTKPISLSEAKETLNAIGEPEDSFIVSLILHVYGAKSLDELSPEFLGEVISTIFKAVSNLYETSCGYETYCNE